MYNIISSFLIVIIDLCSTGHDCHTDAQCVFDVNEMRQKCICDLGFEGDGFSRCTPLPGKYSIFGFEIELSFDLFEYNEYLV